MIFIDYSSLSNTIVPSRLFTKLLDPLCIRLHTHTSLKYNHWICRWHNRGGADLRWEPDSLQRWSLQTGRMVYRKQSITEHKKNKKTHHRLQETMQGHLSSKHQRSSSGQGFQLQVSRSKRLHCPHWKTPSDHAASTEPAAFNRAISELHKTVSPHHHHPNFTITLHITGLKTGKVFQYN